MKAQSIIIFIGFVFLSTVSYAQKGNTVTKGYYSIYRNSQKLEAAKPSVNYFKIQPEESGTITSTKPNKGYFSIGSRKEKKAEIVVVGEPGVLPASQREAKQVVTKGYYSIGKNAAKL